MEILILETGEKGQLLDLVTTIKELTQQFPVSRGSIVMWMYKDHFDWQQVCGTYLIDRASFVEFWNNKYQNSLDVDSTSI